mgnify:CR=1 FL=1
MLKMKTMKQPSIEHIVIAYGDRLDYHFGAKYQIIKGFSDGFYSNKSAISVLTDRPDLYDMLPVNICEISELQKEEWSMGGQQHFGIKLGCLRLSREKSEAEYILMMDTDLFWKRHPAKLIQRIGAGEMAMYKNEGFILKSRNKSIQQFETGLDGKSISINEGFPAYQLDYKSEMWASNVVSITAPQLAVLEHAFELFKALEPKVNAHTVEQFAISEASRLHSVKKIEASRYCFSWSSIGRKEYANTVLRKFFTGNKNARFEELVERAQTISIKRPLMVNIRQKIDRLTR